MRNITRGWALPSTIAVVALFGWAHNFGTTGIALAQTASPAPTLAATPAATASGMHPSPSGVAPSVAPVDSPSAPASASANVPANDDGALHTPIATADELATYLRANEGKKTPFDAFSPVSRVAFLQSLKFGDRGLSGFRTTDLQDELTEPQRYAVLALFGLQKLALELAPEHPSTASDMQTIRRADAAMVPNAGGGGPIERRYAAFEARESSTTGTDVHLGKTLRTAYDANFPGYQTPSNLAKAGDGDVEFLYRVSSETAFYTDDAAPIRDMSLDLTELHKRRLATHRNDTEMYDELVAARQFSAARTFSASHPDVAAPLPAFVDETNAARKAPTILVLSADRSRLVRRTFDLTKPSQVIVVSHPFCHFCQGAVRDIAAIPALQAAMTAHATWLAPPDGATPFDAFHRWNVAHPGDRMTLAYRKSEWPMIDDWSTPTFYFFEHHTLVDTIVGWPPGGRVTDLKRALHEIGLLPSFDDDGT